MSHDKRPPQARDGGGQLASLVSVNSRNYNSYNFKKLDPDESLIVQCLVTGFLVPLRTIIFRGTAPQSGPRHSKETRSSRLCLQISTSLCVPLCLDLSRQRSPLSVNLKLLLSIRDIIAPPSIT